VIGIVAEKFAMRFSGWMRDARALGFDRGGRRHVAKSNAMNATRTPQSLLLFFMFGISDGCRQFCFHTL
jgi:hypothetical protein